MRAESLESKLAKAEEAKGTAEAALQSAAALHGHEVEAVAAERDQLALRLAEAEAHAASLARAHASLQDQQKVWIAPFLVQHKNITPSVYRCAVCLGGCILPVVIRGQSCSACSLSKHMAVEDWASQSA